MQYDNRDVTLSIYAGAGGVDAEDWAALLFRMYRKYCEKKGWKMEIIDKKMNEYGGIDHMVTKITGKDVYKILKQENGVHRLVRISPFSAAKLRHTSFALVEVLPIIQPQEMPFREEDLEISFFRSSGPGGQNVQKVETAVRIKHKPTGIVVSCQQGRSQYQNKQRALEILRAKLHHLAEEKKVKTLQELKGAKQKIEWGNQIRSYVLHPYKMVKDHRTGKKINKVEEVLDGNLELIYQ